MEKERARRLALTRAAALASEHSALAVVAFAFQPAPPWGLKQPAAVADAVVFVAAVLVALVRYSPAVVVAALAVVVVAAAVAEQSEFGDAIEQQHATDEAATAGRERRGPLEAGRTRRTMRAPREEWWAQACARGRWKKTPGSKKDQSQRSGVAQMLRAELVGAPVP